MKNISQVIDELSISIYNRRNTAYPFVVSPYFIKQWNKFFPCQLIVPINKKNKEECE